MQEWQRSKLFAKGDSDVVLGCANSVRLSGFRQQSSNLDGFRRVDSQNLNRCATLRGLAPQERAMPLKVNGPDVLSWMKQLNRHVRVPFRINPGDIRSFEAVTVVAT